MAVVPSDRSPQGNKVQRKQHHHDNAEMYESISGMKVFHRLF